MERYPLSITDAAVLQYLKERGVDSEELAALFIDSSSHSRESEARPEAESTFDTVSNHNSKNVTVDGNNHGIAVEKKLNLEEVEKVEDVEETMAATSAYSLTTRNSRQRV